MYVYGLGTSARWLQYTAAAHRFHHKYSDSDFDRHSPFNKHPIAWIYHEYDNRYLPMTIAEVKALAPDVVPFDDWIQRKVYSKIKYGGAFIIFASYLIWCSLIESIIGTLMTVFVSRTMISFIADAVLHLIGYRTEPGRGADRSKNLFPIGILFYGEELHANHHNHPEVLCYRRPWYEFDLGYWIIKLLAKLNLVRILVREQ